MSENGARICLACLREAPDVGEYHRACLRALFGRDELPALPVSVEEVHQRVHTLLADGQPEDKLSISGVQPKALVRVSENGTLEIVGSGSTHLLKPPSDRFVHLPENEHVTMLLGRALGLVVPPCALLRFADGNLVYVVRRFDRNGGKKHMIDFCQLLELPPEKKYEASAERCVEALAACTHPPGPELDLLFRQLLVGYVLFNGDLHLKNLALLQDAAGLWHVSPAYDLVNTQFYHPTSWRWQLPVDGERSNITRKQWLGLARSCLLSEQAAIDVVDQVLRSLESASSLVLHAPLPGEWKTRYLTLLKKRRRALKVHLSA